MTPIAAALLVSAVLAAAVMDVREKRIPNALTGSLAALALLAHLPEGAEAVAGAAVAALCVFGLGCVAFELGWFGGGDVKLLAASAGAVGFGGTPALVLYVLIAGGAVTLADAAYHRRLKPVLGGTAAVIRRRAVELHDSVPYGVAIAVGACTYVLSVTVAPFLRIPLL